MSCFMVGTAIGPLVGGAMLELSWWGSVFLLTVPVMVLLSLVTLRGKKAPVTDEQEEVGSPV